MYVVDLRWGMQITKDNGKMIFVLWIGSVSCFWNRLKIDFLRCLKFIFITELWAQNVVVEVRIQIFGFSKRLGTSTRWKHLSPLFIYCLVLAQKCFHQLPYEYKQVSFFVITRTTLKSWFSNALLLECNIFQDDFCDAFEIFFLSIWF